MDASEWGGVIMLVVVAWLVTASGFGVNEAATFLQQDCAAGRGYLFCELGSLLARQIPSSAAGTVDSC